MGKVLYAIYGGLLDHEQLREECPTAQPIAKAWLYNHRLAFQRGISSRSDRGPGVITTVLVPAAGHSVPVVIWAVEQGDNAAHFGSVQHYWNHHRRLGNELVEVDGVTRRVIVRYSAGGKYAMPSKRLLKALAKDYAHFNLPVDVLTDAVAFTRKQYEKQEEEKR